MSNPTPSTQQVYNDGNIQYGSFIATVMGPPQPNGTQRCIQIMESFSAARPTKRINRSDEIGGPNGFVLVRAQGTASGVLQMGDSTVARPKVGDWFTQTLDPDIGPERWVIETLTDPREPQTYWKSNITCALATFPAVTPSFTPQ